jgi:hypothetical protein
MKKSILLLSGILFSGLLTAQVVILSEDFSRQQLPSGWLNVDNTGGGDWEFTNPGGRAITTTTASNGFAIFDSDNYGNDATAELAELISPSFNSSAFDSAVTLQFSHYYYNGDVPSTGTAATVDLSVDGGETWIQAALYELVSSGNGEIVDLDITDFVIGAKDVKIRFLYDGSWAYYWAVDDVIITGLIKEGSPLPAAPPVANRDSALCDTSSSVSINVLENDSANDFAIDSLSATVVGNAKFGNTQILENGFIEYSPIEGYIGLDSFTYTITDSENNKSNEATVVISVEPLGNDTIVDPPTSIIELGSNLLSFFPNPAKDFVQFELSDGNNTDSKIIAIFDLTGKMILSEETRKNRIELPSSIKRGTYLVKIISNETQFLGRLIKE